MTKTIKAAAVGLAGVLALSACTSTGASGDDANNDLGGGVLGDGDGQRAGLRGIPGHRRGQGHRVRAVVRRVRRPEPGRGERRRRGRRALLARDRRHPTRGRGSRGRRLEGQRHQRHRDLVGRRVRGPQGQPREHPDLGRPGEARRRGRDPEPRLVRFGTLEHPRGVGPRRRQRRHRRGGRDVRLRPARQHPCAARQRPRGDLGVRRG